MTNIVIVDSDFFYELYVYGYVFVFVCDDKILIEFGLIIWEMEMGKRELEGNYHYCDI
jgi:hypothetical protein